MNRADTGIQELSQGASRRLAAHVAATRYESLAPEVIHAFKRALLDFLTCAVAGGAMPVSRALLSYYEENDATRSATVIGSGVKLSAPNAALVNGANTHGLDFDDGHTHGSAHPAGAIFPAVLAAAEQRGADAKAIVLAAVLGYDVMLRIAAAMHPNSARRGFHNTAIAGVFGAAAAVASLLKLDARQVGHALGLAGSFAGGTREYLDEGAEVKRIHPGKAARDGLLCAEFARRGITGPSKILEGRYGFFRTHADGEIKWVRLFEGLGQRFEISDVYFKPYPCCRHYHAVIDGICALREQHGFSAEDVAHVDLGIYAVGVNGHDHKHCDNLLDAQMSAPCAAALALADGKVAASQFLPESLNRPEIQALLKRIDTHIDEECERIYPGRRSGAVHIALRDGRKLEVRVLDPKGEVANPLSDADLEHKFIANCEPVIGRLRCERLLGQVWRFDELAEAGEILHIDGYETG
ncbi:MAG: MmgE/PrpD family protein [Betaproteobacteria bacterium]|nr:MmgE/PrpD family protein [Betaproteobacteria bacterium]